MALFDRCFEVLIGHEGGYVDHARDPGGRTKYGISQRSYPKEDIRAMTLDRAKEIYRADFWDKCRCDDLPPPLALIVFDAAVNCGPARSVRWLQKAVGAKADGAFGPGTLAAVKAKHDRVAAVCAEALAARFMYQAALPTWDVFGLGWARRIVSLPFTAIQLAVETKSGG